MKTKIISILGMVLILCAGILIGYLIPRKAISTKNQNDTYQAGWDAAKERIKQSPIGMVAPEGMEIKNISGIIEKIEGNKITVKTNSLDPLADPALNTRIINTDSTTKTTVLVQKDQVQFQKEMEDYNVKLKASQENQKDQAPNPIMSPVSFQEKEINLSELRTGQSISVVTSGDIKEKKEFLASEIHAQELVTAIPVGSNDPLVQ